MTSLKVTKCHFYFYFNFNLRSYGQLFVIIYNVYYMNNINVRHTKQLELFYLTPVSLVLVLHIFIFTFNKL